MAWTSSDWLFSPGSFRSLIPCWFKCQRNLDLNIRRLPFYIYRYLLYQQHMTTYDREFAVFSKNLISQKWIDKVREWRLDRSFKKGVPIFWGKTASCKRLNDVVRLRPGMVFLWKESARELFARGCNNQSQIVWKKKVFFWKLSLKAKPAKGPMKSLETEDSYDIFCRELDLLLP